MHYPVRVEGTYTIVSLTGEVDLHVSPDARRQILEHLGENSNVLVDLSAVEYIDSSGIASLVEGLQVAKKSQLEFALVGVNKVVMQVLELARLDKVFPIHQSYDHLLESRSGG